MPRESARDKGGRYLLEGRVVVTHVSQRYGVRASVRGEGEVYATSWKDGTWDCSCPHTAATTDCSHVYALKRIVAVDLSGQETPR